MVHRTAALPPVELAIVGAGVAGCALVAALRQLGWSGSIALFESGRGPGGRASTRRSRDGGAWRIDHGAPLFNLASASPPVLLQPLVESGCIRPFAGTIASLDEHGQLGAALQDGFSTGALWQGVGGMDRIAAGLLALAAAHAGSTRLCHSTLVRRLEPQGPPDRAVDGWILRAVDGTALVHCRWLVLSGTLLAHGRALDLLGWDGVPLQQAAAGCDDQQLHQAAAGLAAITAAPSSNLLLTLTAEQEALWRQQPWRLLQFSPAAQRRFGLRRVSLQPPQTAAAPWAVVAESSPDFADRHRHVHGSGSAAARLLGAPPAPAAEAAVMEALLAAVHDALGLPTTATQARLMRWGAALPQPPGLPVALQLCRVSRIGFCGDAVDAGAMGRLEGAWLSAEHLARLLLPML